MPVSPTRESGSYSADALLKHGQYTYNVYIPAVLKNCKFEAKSSLSWLLILVNIQKKRTSYLALRSIFNTQLLHVNVWHGHRWFSGRMHKCHISKFIDENNCTIFYVIGNLQVATNLIWRRKRKYKGRWSERQGQGSKSIKKTEETRTELTGLYR